MTTDTKDKALHYAVKIERDETADSPRGDCNIATMSCSHSRYTLGDIQENHGRFLDRMKKLCGGEYKIPGRVAVLPLYLFDHSGITLSTTPFSCPWDSGQVGVIYVHIDDLKEGITPESAARMLHPDDCRYETVKGVHTLVTSSDEAFETLKQLRKDFSRTTYSDLLRTAAEEVMKGEVKTYDLFLRNECWGATVFSLDPEEWGTGYLGLSEEKKRPFILEHGAEEESCWNFFGDELDDTGITGHFHMPGYSDEEQTAIFTRAWEARF